MRRRLVLLGMVVAVIAVGAYVRWPRTLQGPTVEAVVGSISEVIVASGRVVAVTEVVVANKIPGRIKQIFVEDGAEVRVGQRLIEFDNMEYVTQVRQAEARLATAQADVRLAQRSVESARARWAEIKSGARSQEVARARADLDQAQERWKNLEIERNRLKRLLDDALIARSQFDAADTETHVARTRVRAAEESLSLVLAGAKPEAVATMWAQVQEAEASLRRAETQVVQARADVEYARAVLETTALHSTVNGKVVRKLVEPGEAVDVGMPLIVIADVTRTLVKVEVDETDAGKLRLEQSAAVTSDAFPGRVFQGRVIEIGQAIGKRKLRPEDPTKIQDMKVLETKLEIAEGGENLTLGMTVDAKITAAQKTGVVMIPRSAVPSGVKEAMVHVVGDGRQERRRLALGASDRLHVEVSDGLRAGERVILDSPPR